MSGNAIPNSLACLRKIFLQELELDDDRINIWNQKFDIPSDENLFIVLSYQPSKVIANRNTVKYNPTTSEYEEIQDVNVQEHITVGIFSRNLDALNRKEEVLMAMASVYSQQLQEKYSFKIARIAPIEDLSVLEATALLYRFDIPLVIFSHYQKIKTVEYFETFDVEVKANGEPLIEKEFTQPTTSLT
jgi:hypothetical protein